MKGHLMGDSCFDEPKVPPNNDEAERAILGAILLDSNVLAILQKDLHSWMFYQSKHQLIFGAMTTLMANGHPVDNVTLSEQLKANGVLAKVGGAAYLAELVAEVGTVTNVKHHAVLVKEAARKRRIRELCIKPFAEPKTPP